MRVLPDPPAGTSYSPSNGGMSRFPARSSRSPSPGPGPAAAPTPAAAGGRPGLARRRAA